MYSYEVDINTMTIMLSKKLFLRSYFGIGIGMAFETEKHDTSAGYKATWSGF